MFKNQKWHSPFLFCDWTGTWPVVLQSFKLLKLLVTSETGSSLFAYKHKLVVYLGFPSVSSVCLGVVLF
jgi:hypothetical protein